MAKKKGVAFVGNSSVFLRGTERKGQWVWKQKIEWTLIKCLCSLSIYHLLRVRGKSWWDMRSDRSQDLQKNHCKEWEWKLAKETSKIPRGSSAGRIPGGGGYFVDQKTEEMREVHPPMVTYDKSPNLGTLGIVGLFVFCCGCWPMHCKMFSSILASIHWMPGARPFQLWQPKMSPWGQNHAVEKRGLSLDPVFFLRCCSDSANIPNLSTSVWVTRV